MNISKVSDITSLRPRDRNNPKIIAAKIDGINHKKEKFIFLTCGVFDSDDAKNYKHFSLKVFVRSGRMNEFINVKEGDYISFSHQLEDSACSQYNKLKIGMAVTIIGKSLYDSQDREDYHVLSVTDINDMVIEVKYIFDLKVKSEEVVIMTGVIEEEDDEVTVLVAKEGHIWN